MKKLIILLLTIIFFTSCEKIMFDKEVESTEPMKNFEYLWDQCNTKYSYFEVKNINWDSIKTQYSSYIYEGMSDDSLFNVLGGMLNELRDDHTNLASNFNMSIFGTDEYGQDNFNWRTIKDNYLPKNYYYTGPFVHDFLLGHNHEIGYIRFSEFSGDIDSTNYNFVLRKYKNTKGLILDLRENGGGAATDVFSLLERFVDKETILFYSREKNGPGHNDFAEPEAAILKPYDGLRYSKKVIMLVDRGTFSAGSFTSLSTKAIPNIILMGDTTGGGLGMPNGGQLPNGWLYRFSVTQALDPVNMSPDWEMGVPPDIVALFDWNDINKDEVIERAVQEIEK